MGWIETGVFKSDNKWFIIVFAYCVHMPKCIDDFASQLKNIQNHWAYIFFSLFYSIIDELRCGQSFFYQALNEEIDDMAMPRYRVYLDLQSPVSMYHRYFCLTLYQTQKRRSS